MGFMDNFTSDTPVEVKQPDYFSMMKEAAKAELLLNAVKCGVPTSYINAMATGKMEMPLFTEELSVEMEAEEPEAWGSITTAVKSILGEWEIDSQVEDMAKSLHEAIDVLKKARIKEVRMKQYVAWADENERKCETGWSCNTCFHYRKGKHIPICETCEDGSKYTPDNIEKDTEQQNESEETQNGNK